MCEVEKAYCPECGKRIKCDWDMNKLIVLTNDKPELCNETEVFMPEDTRLLVTNLNCTCGQTLGTWIVDQEVGAMLYLIKEFQDIVWDLEENAIEFIK